MTGFLKFLRLDWPFWGFGLLIIIMASTLAFASGWFSYDYAVREMPVTLLVIGLIGCGLLFLLFVYVVIQMAEHHDRPSRFVLLVFIIGLIARLSLLFSEPVLEDDYQRYLWDGAVVVLGETPYRYSPAMIMEGAAPESLQRLSDQAWPLVELINHPELRSLYPPGAMGFFALSYMLKPFSLISWRAVVILAEMVTFICLLLVFRHISRDPKWLTLYWWNPLVIKELINSAHMEAVLMPFLVLALLLGLKRAYGLSLLSVLGAASIKIWPLLLTPLLLRRFIDQPSKFLCSLLLVLLVSAAILWPLVASGLDETSGLLAYSQNWTTNSALSPALEAFGGGLLALFGSYSETLAPVFARGLICLILLTVIGWMFVRPLSCKRPFMAAMFSISVLVLLLSPAQFPWYFVWIAPFITIYPVAGLLWLVPLINLYYAGFGLMAAGEFDFWRPLLAGFIWLPAWGLLIAEWVWRRSRI